MGHGEHWNHMVFHRMDRISNMLIYEEPATPITSIRGYENGIDFKRISSSMPYMYSAPPERIEFIADEYIIDQVVDWFGKDIKMTRLPEDEKKIKVELIASPNAMQYWALQYLTPVEVIKPESLREKIREALHNGIRKYD